MLKEIDGERHRVLVMQQVEFCNIIPAEHSRRGRSRRVAPYTCQYHRGDTAAQAEIIDAKFYRRRSHIAPTHDSSSVQLRGEVATSAGWGARARAPCDGEGRNSTHPVRPPSPPQPPREAPSRAKSTPKSASIHHDHSRYDTRYHHGPSGPPSRWEGEAEGYGIQTSHLVSLRPVRPQQISTTSSPKTGLKM